MKTVDIMEMLTDAIDKKIFGEWKHEGFICGNSSEHINFEIDGKEYVLRIKEVKDGEHWSDTGTASSATNVYKKDKKLQDYLELSGVPEKLYGSDIY